MRDRLLFVRLLAVVCALALTALALPGGSSAAACPPGQVGIPPYCAPSPPPNEFQLGKIKHPSTGVVTIRVKVPGPGTVKASGKRMKTVTVKLGGGGAFTLKLQLSRRGLAALEASRGRQLRVRVSFVYTPTGGQPRTKAKKIIFRVVKRPAHGRSRPAVAFAAPAAALTVTSAGTGTGTVTSFPAGIDCGATCAAAFELGYTVMLYATPGDGSTFTGWSGACAGTATCSVTLDEARQVTATFDGSLPGGVVVGARVRVARREALIRLFCGGPSSCRSKLSLIARLRAGGSKPRRNVSVGSASFNLRPGASTLLHLELSRPAWRLLKRGKLLRARVTGKGVHPHGVRLRLSGRSSGPPGFPPGAGGGAVGSGRLGP